MTEKHNIYNTAKIRNYRRKIAKALRDDLINTIISWKEKEQDELLKSGLEPDQHTYAISKVECEAYQGLVWRALDPNELYNTPYHKSVIDDIKKEHPDLIVSKCTKYIVSYHLFKKEDIEAAMSVDIKPLFFHK
ncbi:MAG: hypothetical protein AMQ22_02307 [Candidatus Methanofastidiosum methylothiophilum]|jgi:hypothetical protein|uniref:Uncharacterized protein n=1 Tax=Candidatus Methanofastidiosum methylothiophilum TaxID=1705564 RepID=A0A150IHI0_9EURY|nr:MAG: hypothetical protein AMQ22_02307 [Candidatus Methanofastidiosum methylthiophilus]